MDYDMKVLLSLLAQAIARTETVEEAYSIIANAANVEGLLIPAYKEMRDKIQEMRKGN
ncbi:MAG: hypothetical protein FWH20_04520 [Oscillospiraceae bacterium]|nr:hypothetical protein [Oscillospiraceae bacterium]